MKRAGWSGPTCSPETGVALFDAVHVHPLASAGREGSRSYLLWRRGQRAPIDLSIRSLRQIRLDMEPLGDEMLLQQARAMAPQRALVDVLGHHMGRHGLAEQRVGDADDGGLAHGGMA